MALQDLVDRLVLQGAVEVLLVYQGSGVHPVKMVLLDPPVVGGMGLREILGQLEQLGQTGQLGKLAFGIRGLVLTPLVLLECLEEGNAEATECRLGKHE